MVEGTDDPVITDGRAVDDLAALEGVFVAAFGAGDRRPGWFPRKLAREGAEAGLTVILWEGAAPVGALLIGRLPSKPGVAWASGLGVAPRLQGRGLGRALIEAAVERCAAVGLDRVELLAEPARVGFYRRLGFVVGDERVTLGARARGRRSLAPPPGAYDLAGAASCGGWIEEAWTRTPAAERSTHRVAVDVDGAAEVLAHVSREGSARLIHRVLVAPREAGRGPWPTEVVERAAHAGVSALLEQIAAPSQVILFGVDPGSWLHQALVADGWSALQRHVAVTRSLRPGDR